LTAYLPLHFFYFLRMFFQNKLPNSYTSIIKIAHLSRAIWLGHLCGSWNGSIPSRFTLLMVPLCFMVSQSYHSKTLPFSHSATTVGISSVGSIMEWNKSFLTETRFWLLLDQKISLNFVILRVRFDELVLIAWIASSQKTHRLNFDTETIYINLVCYLRHIMEDQVCTCPPTHHFWDFTLKIVSLWKASSKLLVAALFSLSNHHGRLVLRIRRDSG
jgi:hypothetical protein